MVTEGRIRPPDSKCCMDDRILLVFAAMLKGDTTALLVVALGSVVVVVMGLSVVVSTVITTVAVVVSTCEHTKTDVKETKQKKLRAVLESTVDGDEAAKWEGGSVSSSSTNSVLGIGVVVDGASNRQQMKLALGLNAWLKPSQ